MLFWFLAARTYPANVVGLATAGTAMLVLLATIGQLGLGVGIMRYAAVLGPHRSRRLVGIFLVTLLVALLVGAIFWRLVPYVAPGLAPVFTSLFDVALFVGSCAGWALSAQFDSYLMSRRFMGLLVLDNTITALSRLLFIGALPHPSIALLIAVTGASGLIGVAAVIPFVLRRPFLPPAESAGPVPLRTLVSYSFWNYWTTVMGTVSVLAMPSLIVTWVDSAQAAAYYMVWSLFSGLLMVPAALAQTLLAVRSGHGQPGLPAMLKGWRSTGLALLLGALFVPPAMLVLVLLGGSYAARGWSVLLVFVAGFLPYYRAVLLQTELRLVGSQRLQAAAYTACHLTVIGISIPLLILLGPSGAALAWTIGQCLLYVALRWSLQVGRSRGTSQ